MRKLGIIFLSVGIILLVSCGDSKVRKPLAEMSLQDMTVVPAGTYRMGSEKFGGMGAPIKLTSFYISKYNVSYKKYDLYTEATGKKYVDPVGKKYNDYTRSPNHPVDNLTWYQANNYCQYLREITGLPYDLPTEEQWEYVARNNGKPNWDFPTNDGKQELGKNFPDVKLYTHQAGADGGDEVFPLPIGSIPCTPQGICGMSGAVNEWTKTAVSNKRIVRGQGAGGSPEFANVYAGTPIDADKDWAGFRCVINNDKPMSELQKIAAQNLQ
jgi:formylglycine-generating enzyme required for sulfatase activity